MAELYSAGVTGFHNKSWEMLLNNVDISFPPDLFFSWGSLSVVEIFENL